LLDRLSIIDEFYLLSTN